MQSKISKIIKLWNVRGERRRLSVRALNIPIYWLNTTDRMTQQWLLRQQRWHTSCDLLCLLPWHLCQSKCCEVGLSSVAMTADMMTHEVNQQWCFWQTDGRVERETERQCRQKSSYTVNSMIGRLSHIWCVLNLASYYLSFSINDRIRQH